MSEYFPEPIYSGGRVKVELDLPNYATKADLRTATDVDTSKFAKKVDLASLKSEYDKLDIDELKNVPTNINNLKNKGDILDIGKVETTPVDLNKLSNVVKNDVVNKDVCNTKFKDIEDKICNITNVAINTTPNA